MTSTTFRIATRQSPLALWQANHVRDQLIKQWPDLKVELLPMVTSGDKFIKDKLQAMGGKGLFVKELEEALLDKRADIAVHSSKDMPAELPPGLILGAICERENPFDAFVSKSYKRIDSLPNNAIIGTSSLRRQSQLLAYRADLQIKPLRGNINTRLSKLDHGEFDAIILAAAGLERMGYADSMTEILAEEIMLPACGQGALCIECREDDLHSQTLITSLNHVVSATCVSMERLVNAQLGGNCHVPLAVYATASDPSSLSIRAKILSHDGQKIIKDRQQGSFEEASDIAMRCAHALLVKGADQLLESH
jgi:hydroxymethylbilane synthase